MKPCLLITAAALIAANPALSMDNTALRDADKLLSTLSLDEKIGQMVQLDLSVVTKPHTSPIQLDPVRLHEALVTYKIGSFINNGLGRALSRDEWASVHRAIQDLIRAETPHKIPLLYGIDSIHG